MKYTRSSLNKDGVILCDKEADFFSHEEALARVNDWRMLHFRPLKELEVQLNALFVSNNIAFEFSSQRIKRMTSILGKLEVNPQMRLGGLQDIGGIRYVFASVGSVQVAAKVISEATFEGFELTKINDYISSPKCSGYRSIHFVYKYHSEDTNYDGLQIELQIRTRLQHSWAMAVETAGVIVKTSLKANTDDNPEWRHFFKLVSAILARTENSNVNEAFADYDKNRFLAEYHSLDASSKFLDKLKALRVTATTDSIVNEDNALCVLYIDYSKRRLTYKVYGKNDAQKATELFTSMEGKIDNSTTAVLLTSVAKMIELREAYPSYFLDSQEFIEAIEMFIK
ncbi:MAG: RelA/SpoT domain-containing protein [Bacteroidales bacterium]|nr:RelA/SpoT domain-containing protein [Bacteroidales bacterium]